MYLAAAPSPTEPPPSSAQEQDDDPLAYRPPTLTTTSTSASSSLPLTPRTPYLGRFSTGRSYQPSLPGHREEDESRSVGLSSTSQFAFSPPSEPVSVSLSPLARPGSMTSESPSSSGAGLATQRIPLSTYSYSDYNDSERSGLSVPSTPRSLSKVTKVFSPPGGISEKPVALFHEVREVHVQGMVESVEEINDGEVEDSPFVEVRASVSNVDDPEMPCLTFRMWVLGIAFCLMLNGGNIFFYLRYPSPYWTGPVGIVLAWLGGKLLEKILPIRLWTIAGYEFSLNPGPFNIKEHTLVYLLGGITWDSSTSPYPMGATVVWEKRYHQALTTGFDFLFVISSQILGFGLVGLCHRLLVWPASAIWPSALATCATLNALHAGDGAYSNRKGPRQVTFFTAAAVAAGIWAFFPGYIFTALSYFSFVCWIFPNNVVVNQLFGVVSGLGMSIITLDWTQITMAPSPLTTPFWSQLHTFGAFVFFYWIVGPTLYYSNVWKSAHLPVFGGLAYDRFAQPYNLTRVFNPETLRFNSTAYEEYSPVYLPISFAITYLLAFAIPPATLVHAVLVYWPKISGFIHRQPPNDEPDDIHAKLMRRYSDVPWWWYGAVFVVALTLSIGAIKVQPELELPLGTILLATLLAAIWVIPTCYIAAISGQAPAINVIAQIIPGALWQERPLVNMVFKVYVVQGIGVTNLFVRAAKLGHYMKIPPRYRFTVQAVGLSITSLIQLWMKSVIFAGVQDICQPDQSARLVCAHSQVFYSASIIWGLIGPRRQFGKGGVYYGEIYTLIAGALLPLLIWWWCRFRPDSPLRKLNVPVALAVCTYSPPATGINYTSAFFLGIISQWYMRTRKSYWWARYNYILAGALDSGTGLGVVICFLILQLPKGGNVVFKWWGNTVWQNTLDANGVAFLPTDPNVGF